MEQLLDSGGWCMDVVRFVGIVGIGKEPASRWDPRYSCLPACVRSSGTAGRLWYQLRVMQPAEDDAMQNPLLSSTLGRCCARNRGSPMTVPMEPLRGSCYSVSLPFSTTRWRPRRSTPSRSFKISKAAPPPPKRTPASHRARGRRAHAWILSASLRAPPIHVCHLRQGADQHPESVDVSVSFSFQFSSVCCFPYCLIDLFCLTVAVWLMMRNRWRFSFFETRFLPLYR